MRRSRFASTEPLEARRLLAAQLLATVDATPSRLTPVGRDLYYVLDNRTLQRVDSAGNVRTIRRDDGKRWNLTDNYYERTALVDAGGRAFLVAKDVGGGPLGLWHIDRRTSRPVSLLPAGVAVVHNDAHDEFVAFKGALYFAASSAGSGNDLRLWRSDGTPAGTTPFADLRIPAATTVAGRHMYFRAEAPGGGAGVFRTDGTAAGTIKLLDVTSNGVSEMTAVGNGVYFVRGAHLGNVSNDFGYSLWHSDGTTAGTRHVYGEFGHGLIHDLTAVGSRLYFTQFGAGGGRDVWVSDGTEAGTRRVAAVGLSGYDDNRFFAWRDSLVFSTYDSAATNTAAAGQLWRVGADDKPVQLDESVRELRTLGDRIYFSDGTLHTSDGTVTGTRSQGLPARDLAAGAANVYFSSGRQLWADNPKTGGVAGVVFNDANRNGAHDRGEVFTMPGFRVFADLNGDARYNAGEPMGRTDEAGNYRIGGLLPGAHAIRLSRVQGWEPTSPDARTVTVRRDHMALAHFANAGANVTLAGAVYRDDNENGMRDAGEAGAAGFRVFLDRDGDRRWDRSEPAARSGSDGTYRLSDLAVGHNTFGVVAVDGWRFTSESSKFIPMGPGKAYAHAFGVTHRAAVRGKVTVIGEFPPSDAFAGWRVFADLDDDGAFDAAAEPSTLTGTDGQWVLRMLDAGTHRLRVLSRDGYRALVSELLVAVPAAAVIEDREFLGMRA